jgi:plastocyanin
MKITGSLIVCVVAAGFTATALLINPDPTQPSTAAAVGASQEIAISQFTFSSAAVAPGATFTVDNLDGVEHTVTATDGSFESGVVAAGGAVGLVAPALPGVYPFFCAIHPSMTGQLTVQAAGQV